MDGCHYSHILVPLALPWVPVYRSLTALERGQSVRVGLAGKSYDGIVLDTLPEDKRPELDDSRIEWVIQESNDVSGATEEELRLWEFISSYYLCSPCEVYRAARPEFYAARERAIAAARRKQRSRIEKKLETARNKKRRRSEEQIAALEQELAAFDASLEPWAPPIRKSHADKPELVVGFRRKDYYLNSIRATLAEGRQVLVLAPDSGTCEHLGRAIAGGLTGETIYTITARTTNAQRGAAVSSARSRRPCCIVSIKNGIFLPFSNLGLVIVDEEQDPLYRQTASSPRFNGRDCAVMLASIRGAGCMLGTPLPSLESANNCSNGKYTLTELNDAGGSLEVVDIRSERRKNGLHGAFTNILLSAIRRCGGPVVLVRGWEKEEEIREEIETLLPEGTDIRVMSMPQLRQEGCSGCALLALLQADAFIGREDFRGDEKALQMVAWMRSIAPAVLVQTEIKERFDGCRSVDSLLQERRHFNFPPYSRVVEICSAHDNKVVSRHFLKPGRTLADEKNSLKASLRPGQYILVDG